MESKSNKHGDINLGNVHGNVILNQNQSGGTTAHNINTRGNENSIKNKKAKIRIFTCLGGLASTVTILAYFGMFPFNQKNKNITPKNDSIKTTIVEQKINGISNSAATPQRNNHPKQSIKMSTEKEKKVNSGISLGNVSGDVIISQGQTGGITAHTVNINEPALPPRHLSNEDKNELISFANQSVSLETSMEDIEAKEYGQEICDYLVSIGCSVSRTLYGMAIGGSSEKSRFSINGNNIFVPVNKR